MESRAATDCGEKETLVVMDFIQPPHTYAEWAQVLDILQSKTEDNAVLQAMQEGTVKWQASVAERLARRLSDAVNTRMNMATDHFQQSIRHAGGQEGPLVQALLTLRHDLAFLYAAADIPAVPEKERTQLRGLIRQQADKMQRSLEDTAQKDRSGKMSSLVRNHRVNVLE